MIYKYELPDRPCVSRITVNSNVFTPISVQVQHGLPMLWAITNPESKGSTELDVIAVMTEQQEPKDAIYLGTALLHDGNFVLHYFGYK